VTRLRVLHVGKFYPPVSGGMEKVLRVVCDAERAVVDSHVLVANDAPATVRESVNGVPVTRVASLTKVGAVAICPTFPYWLRRLPCDIMVVHEPNPVALVAHWLVRPKARLIFWVHAEVVRPQWRYKAFYRPFLRQLQEAARRLRKPVLFVHGDTHLYKDDEPLPGLRRIEVWGSRFVAWLRGSIEADKLYVDLGGHH